MCKASFFSVVFYSLCIIIIIGDSMRKVTRRKDPSDFNLFDKISYFFNFICKSFLYAVLSLMVILCVMFGIYFVDLLTNVKTGNHKFPIFGSYVILTKSMIPTINVNDAVLVKRSELEEFDIIRINSGILVNYEYIFRIMQEEVELLDHTILPISRARRNYVSEFVKGKANMGK